MNRIKHYRNAVNATQKDLGEVIGVGQSTIDRYESGERKVNVSTAWSIVNALNTFNANCSFSDVFPEPQMNSSANN
ncbi:helix-turn-helix transcriptional regulator [Vibrio parahaemolyticus]|uniref:helix-turn-helix transcriptional regulator n=1 Tax=Vibrio parahaemolyticus TaxID=670 RepID=UPI0004153DBE|nr:helix-turn-helix transcriptional regulator [Vibrio parahaemolyticus]